MCLVVDQANSALSQNDDGYIGGAKYTYGKGTHVQVKVQCIDKHLTILSFIVLTGERVLCLVIVAGV